VADDACYRLHSLFMRPLEWSAVSAAADCIRTALAERGGELFGAWRSQIGRPRDAVTIITRWPAGATAGADAALAGALPPMRAASGADIRPTLRPLEGTAPARQGNYAFRRFTTPEADWPEFLDLCAGAWPGFEAAYDSQVIGLWRFAALKDGLVESLLLTRRPDLAMWERSKLPANAAEADVRRKLSRRYDLCIDTDVYTTTLLTAEDHADEARWT